MHSTNSTKNAAYSPSTAIPKPPKLAYLGLYALQHRGQESAGIATSDGREIHCHKSMGHVADIFTPECSASCPATLAIGHTRYSTAGDTVLLNAQPFSVACNKGQVAVAHNGNITNAAELRHELEARRLDFSGSSDTEVILHLVARSRERTLAARLRDALLQLEGAFSLVFLAEDRMIVARDPHGFRPLAMGQMEMSGGTAVLCLRVGDVRVRSDRRRLSERCGARRNGDRRAGRHDARTLRSRSDRAQCVFEHVYFSRPGFHRVRPPGAGIARESGPAAGPRSSRRRRYRGAGARFRRGRRARLRRRIGLPFRQALIRNHYVGRTFIEPSQAIRDFGVKLKLNPVRYLLEGKRVVLVDDSIVRGTTSRKIVRMVRSAGAREVHMRISCPPTISPCFYGVDTPSEERADRGQQYHRRDPPLRGSRFARLPVAAHRCAQAVEDTDNTTIATRATRATIRPSLSTSRN